MTGKTHRVGGMLCCLGGYLVLESNGMLLEGVNPLLQLAVMYPFAIYGSVVSDLDHNWQSAPSKDVVSLGINKVLHLSTKLREKKKGKSIGILGLFDAKHRSWQTHSDLFLLAMSYVSYMLLNTSASSLDHVILKLVSMGLVLGVASHLFLDMLTPEGIWSILLLVLSKAFSIKGIPEKISFVPNTSFFRTGGTWENLVRALMWVVCMVIFIYILLSVCNINLIVT